MKKNRQKYKAIKIRITYASEVHSIMETITIRPPLNFKQSKTEYFFKSAVIASNSKTFKQFSSISVYHYLYVLIGVENHGQGE